MQNKEIFEYLFKGFISVVLVLSMYIFQGFESSINRIQESVVKLNISFATFSEKLIAQKEDSIQLGERVTLLETGLASTMATRWTKQDHKEFLVELRKEIERINNRIDDKKSKAN